jgi:hypothetical protein
MDLSRAFSLCAYWYMCVLKWTALNKLWLVDEYPRYWAPFIKIYTVDILYYGGDRRILSFFKGEVQRSGAKVTSANV